jgi:hypothetical protein
MSGDAVLLLLRYYLLGIYTVKKFKTIFYFVVVIHIL